MSSNNIKNALVTGAAKRLGREIAIALAKAGWNVAVHYNTTAPDDVLAEIRKYGVKATAIKADLFDFKQVRKLIPAAAKELGEITLLVNSASIFEKAGFMKTDEKLFDQNLNIHLKAPFFLAQDLARQTKNGQIINIIDRDIERATSLHFAYLLTKKSLRDLTRMLAPELRANAVLPGPIEELPSVDDDIKYLKTRKSVAVKDVVAAVISLSESTATGQEIFI